MTKFSDVVKQVEDEGGPEGRAEFDAFRRQFARANQLIELRRAHNLTQQQLADVTGVQQADISRIERGVANPTAATLDRLGAPFGMHVGWVSDDHLANA
jgi:DNA-binding XRE family transcriptional regulator